MIKRSGPQVTGVAPPLASPPHPTEDIALTAHYDRNN